MNNFITLFSKLKSTTMLIVGLTIVLSSCVRDDLSVPVIPKVNGTDVTFSIQLPKGATPSSATRALDETAENNIISIEALVFESNNGGYLYTAYSTDIRTGGSTSEKVFTIKLIKSDACDLIILANSKTVLTTAYPAGITEGTLRTDVIENLTIGLPTGDKWNSTSGSGGYTDIPMWGEKLNVNINQGTNINDVNMSRMLSRVDVSLSAEAQVDFKLRSVHVYNYNTKGTIIPRSTDWKEDATPKPKAINPHVPATSSLTKGPLNYAVTGDIENRSEIYLLEAKKGTDTSLDKNTCLVVGGEYKDGKTYYYRIDFARTVDADPSPVTTYLDLLRNHRYDVSIVAVTGPGFENEEDAFNSRPINIEVGILTWNESEMSEVVFDGQNFLSVNKQVFNLNMLAYTTLVKDNTLIIHTDYVNRNDATKSGWKISKITGADGMTSASWLTIPPLQMSGIANSRAEVRLQLSRNGTGEPRTGLIHIEAGRLRYVVKVVQSDELEASMQVLQKGTDGMWREIKTIDFMQDENGDIVTPVEYKVVWQPATLKLNIVANTSAIPIANRLVWESTELSPISKGSSVSDAKGEVYFTIQPQSITNYVKGSFSKREQLFTFSIRSSDNFPPDILVSTTFPIRHFVKDIKIEAKTSIMDGNGKYYTVLSNVPWKVDVFENVSDGAKAGGIADVAVASSWTKIAPGDAPVTAIKSGTYNLPEGTILSYNTVKDIATYGSYVKPIIIAGTLGLRAYAQEAGSTLEYEKRIRLVSAVDMTGREANSYVLDPTSGVGISIPLIGIRAGVFNQENVETGKPNLYIPPKLVGNFTHSYTTTPIIVWSTGRGSNGTALDDDAMISKLYISSDNSYNYYMLIMPGNQEPDATKIMGNALISSSATNKNEINWGWHIWVTDEMKYSKDGIMQGIIKGGYNGTELDENGSPRIMNGQPTAGNWMDRNLGALTNQPLSYKTFGNYYQWGNPSPFTGGMVAVSSNTNQLIPLYDENGPTRASTEYHEMTSPKDIAKYPGFMFNNKYLIYLGANDMHDLWGVSFGGADLGKSILDPCPAGWRVPVRANKSYNDITNTKDWGNETANISSVGLGSWDPAALGYRLNDPNLPYKGGFYPTAGYTNTADSKGDMGQYHRATSANPPITVGAVSLHMFRISSEKYSDYRFIPSSLLQNSSPYSVRCVKENF